MSDGWRINNSNIHIVHSHTLFVMQMRRESLEVGIFYERDIANYGQS